MLDSSQLPDLILPLEVKFLVVALLLEDPVFLSLYVNNKVRCYILLNNCKENGGTALSLACVDFARLSEKKFHLSCPDSISSIECINRLCVC